MTTENNRGGTRKGAGRKRDYFRQAVLFAVGTVYCCSEATAKRKLAMYNGDYQRLLMGQSGGEYREWLDDWDSFDAFSQGRMLGWIETDNVRMRQQHGLV